MIEATIGKEVAVVAPSCPVLGFTYHAKMRSRWSSYRWTSSSTLLCFEVGKLIAAQGVLAAAISSQRITPLFGAVVAVALMICGLLLIVAELLTATSR